MTTAYRKVPCGHEPTDYPHSMPNDDGSVDCDGFTYEPWPEVEALTRYVNLGTPEQIEALVEAASELFKQRIEQEYDN